MTRFGIRLDEDTSEMSAKRKDTDAIESHDKILCWIIYISQTIQREKAYLCRWYEATLKLQRDYWLSRVLVTSEMDNRGLPASGFESAGQLGPFPPLPLLMIPRDGGGAEGGTRRCCCWCCCPLRCPWPCLLPPPSPFPQLTAACCNQMDGLPVILRVLTIILLLL